MNHFIVEDYFIKLKASLTKLELFDKPDNIYNMNEKVCCLKIHKQLLILATIGVKRIHLTAAELGENVSIVGCVMTLCQNVSPFYPFQR